MRVKEFNFLYFLILSNDIDQFDCNKSRVVSFFIL